MDLSNKFYHISPCINPDPQDDSGDWVCEDSLWQILNQYFQQKYLIHSMESNILVVRYLREIGVTVNDEYF